MIVSRLSTLLGFRLVELEPSPTRLKILVVEFAKHKQNLLVHKDFFTLHVNVRGEVSSVKTGLLNKSI